MCYTCMIVYINILSMNKENCKLKFIIYYIIWLMYFQNPLKTNIPILCNNEPFF